MPEKDAFDQWWEWANKDQLERRTIPEEIHEAMMALPPDEWHDREKVNAAVRDGLRLGPVFPAGSADLHGIPRATE